MKVFKALFKLINNLHKKVDVTENYSEPNYSEPNVQEPVQQKQPIEEESNVKPIIENPCVNQIREWAITKIDLLHEADRHRNARALAAEFDEWINIPDDVEELNYLSIENEDWTDDQEVDVK